MAYPDDRVYSETHEWHKLDGDILTMGLTRFAVDSLTDVTYVEMKEVGTVIAAGESVGEVESVKTTSDVFSALDGEVVEVNEKLGDDPGLVNSDPHGEGWLVRLRVGDSTGLESRLNADEYEKQLG